VAREGSLGSAVRCYPGPATPDRPKSGTLRVSWCWSAMIIGRRGRVALRNSRSAGPIAQGDGCPHAAPGLPMAFGTGFGGLSSIRFLWGVFRSRLSARAIFQSPRVGWTRQCFFSVAGAVVRWDTALRGAGLAVEGIRDFCGRPCASAAGPTPFIAVLSYSCAAKIIASRFSARRWWGGGWGLEATSPPWGARKSACEFAFHRHRAPIARTRLAAAGPG